MKIIRFGISMLAVLICATPALAQDRKAIPQSELSKYVVSAKAGLVNVVEGEATVIRAASSTPPNESMLISGDELLTHDTVKTGPGGRAEILLNPGCFLRLGENSEFAYLFDTTSGNRIKLLRGSAVIEASAMDESILVETPKAKFDVVRVGIYRFDVTSDGKADVAVTKGRVVVGDTTIKEGKRAAVEGNTATVSRFNKKETDDLDDWSKNRAKSLIAANSRLSNRGMSRTFGMSSAYNAWIYDTFCHCYTFLPYTGGYSSPYGWNYSVYNPYWYYPRNDYSGWNGGGHANTGGGSGGGSGSGGGPSKGGHPGSGSGGGAHQPSPSPITRAPERSIGGGERSSGRERPTSPRHP